jgi:LuxR family maltose regulon positive regulatory protein
LFSWLEAPSITQARVLTAAGSEQNLLDATRRLQAIREVCEACRFPCQVIEVGTLQSLALEKLGRGGEACHALEETIKLSRPGGWIRPFVEAGPPMVDLLKQLFKNSTAADYIEKILAAFGDEGDVHARPSPMKDPAPSDVSPAPSPAPIQPLVEPLTHRELDVLELLSERLQNKEIAEKLSISPLTVKSHLQSIYQKLCVENRRQALEKSRELGILHI